MRVWSNPFIVVVAVILAVGPIMRGLFFPPEQLVVAGALCGVGILWGIDRHRQARPPFRRFSLVEAGALLVPVAYAVPAVRAVYPHGALLGLVAGVAGYAVYAISRDAPVGGPRGRMLAASIVVGATAVAALGLASYLQVLSLPAGVTLDWRMAPSLGRVSSTFQYSNALAAYLGVGLLLAVSLQHPDKPGWRGSVWRATAGLMAAALVLTQSRAAILLLPAAALGLVLLAPAGRRVQIMGELGGIAAGGLLTVDPIIQSVAVHQPWMGLAWIIAAALVAAGPWGVLVARARRYGWWTQPALALVTAGMMVAVFAYGHVADTPAATRLNQTATTAAVALSDDTPLPADQISRLYYVRDATVLLRDYPVTGTGGGGWAVLFSRYRTSPYFSTQVHSFYAQYAVETGSLGLIALLLFLSGLALTAVRVLGVRQGGMERMQVAGVLAALTMLLLHSAVDFDLSYLSMYLILWSLAGSLNGEVRRLSPEEWVGDVASAERRFLSGSRRHGSGSLVPGQGTTSASKWRAGWLSAVMVAAFAVTGLVAAMLLGGQAFKAWAAHRADTGNLASAERNYVRSLRFNPRDDESYLALADLYRRQAVELAASDPTNVRGHQALLDQSVRSAEQALLVNPQSPRVRLEAARRYLAAGRPEQAIQEARRVEAEDPWEQGGYEVAAQAESAMAFEALMNGDREPARRQFGQVVEDGLALQFRADEFASRQVKVGRPPRVQGRLALAMGQAYYFLRNPSQAEKYLRLAGGDAQVRAESEPWLAVLWRSTGPKGKDAGLQRQPWVRQAFQDEKFLALAALPQLD